MKILRSYFKKRSASLALLTIFVIIFSVTFFLYDLPVESVCYAAVLCCIPASIWLLVDLLRYRRTLLQLQLAQESIGLDLSRLPETGNEIERSYQQLLELLHAEKTALGTRADLRNRELLDYYTLWVHQVKVPLSALKLLLDAQAQPHKEMENELFKIERYVDMVLGYLRMESMSSDLMIRRYSLDEICRQIIRKYSSLFITKKISLEMQTLNKDVLTDEKWLVFALEQLLSNAIKYTPEGGRVRIYLSQADSLTIEDNGIGIAPEDLSRVFERGYTGYNGRIDKKASGLGLYLCRRILQQLGHSISIASELHVGTRVTVGLREAQLRVE